MWTIALATAAGVFGGSRWVGVVRVFGGIGVVRLRSGVADGTGVEVEFVDQFFTDDDLHTSRWSIGSGRIFAGEDFGVIGCGGARDRVVVEGDLERGRVVGGGIVGNGEVDVACYIIASGEGASEEGLQWGGFSGRLGGSRFFGWGFGGSQFFRWGFGGLYGFAVGQSYIPTYL